MPTELFLDAQGKWTAEKIGFHRNDGNRNGIWSVWWDQNVDTSNGERVSNTILNMKVPSAYGITTVDAPQPRMLLGRGLQNPSWTLVDGVANRGIV
jgi:hypothetical protein